MKHIKWIGNGLRSVALITAVVTPIGCSETAEPPEEHAEADGVNLIVSGQAVASYDGDEQSWDRRTGSHRRRPNRADHRHLY